MSQPFLDTLARLHTEKNTSLCVGLDPSINALPTGYPHSIDGLIHYCKDIIDATHHAAVAFKPNLAFFEVLGIEGLKALESIRAHVTDVPVIIDAKRGDIGTTAQMQARHLYDYLNADATTLHPYMGLDSLGPFFEYTNKFNFVLALTSNPSASDFECQPLTTGIPLHSHILSTLQCWHQRYGTVGAVVGATSNKLQSVRHVAPDLLYLIPGVGAQGGRYLDALAAGKNTQGLAIINVSRSLLTAVKDKRSLQNDIQTTLNHILTL